VSRAPNTLGDAPIEPQHIAQMNTLAAFVDQMFNGEKRGPDRSTGFVLLVFPFGEHAAGRCNFISNGAARHDLAVLFREMAARFEGMPELKPTRQ